MILQFWGKALENELFISIDVEPFNHKLFSHSKGGAYPHDPSVPLLPIAMFMQWEHDNLDSTFINAIREAASVISKQAISEGQTKADKILYPNYALSGTPLSDLYGDNVDRLKAIKRKYDPHNVMGLAGGFKF
jgi:FAD/FMN-containing dehydrogenase